MPKQLRLISIESIRAQDGPDIPAHFSFGPGNTVTMVPVKREVDENLKLRVILDGQIRQTIDIGDLKAGTRHDFRPNGALVFRNFVQSAEIALREEDDAFIEGLIDDNPDDTIGPLPLPLHIPGDEDSAVHELAISNDPNRGYDSAGANYVLRYQILNDEVQYDSRFLQSDWFEGDTGGAPEGSTEGDWKQDKGNTRWICALDGGGMRGIVALRALEQLEEYYKAPCSTMFDMFAGTSTGGILAAALAVGVPVRALIALYRREDIRKTIFDPNKESQQEALNLFRFPDGFEVLGVRVRNVEELIDLSQVGGDKLREARDKIAENLITPRFRKEKWRAILAAIFSRPGASRREFLTLADAKAPADPENGYAGGPKDLFLTAYDMVRGETTYFTAFHDRKQTAHDAPNIPPGPATPKPRVFGTYQDVRLVDAVEASASPPYFFSPVDRFVDGGVGAYNSPAFAAAVEALFYSRPAGGLSDTTKPPLYEPYSPAANGSPAKGTVVWSFGTGAKTESGESVITDIAGYISAQKRSDTIAFWGEKVVDSLLLDAAKQQDFLCRKVLADKVRYYRFNIIVNESTLRDRLNLSPPLNSSYEEMVGRVKLAAIEPEDFEVVDDIGRAYARLLREGRFYFSEGGKTVGAEEAAEEVAIYTDVVKSKLLERL